MYRCNYICKLMLNATKEVYQHNIKQAFCFVSSFMTL